MLFQVTVNRPLVIIFCILLSVIASTSITSASSYDSQGPFVTPAPGFFIPTPTQIPGKEYSSNYDWDASYTPDQQQNLAWDGAGGVMDALDYTNPFGGFGDVDAISQTNDALFHSVINNTSTLLFSVSNSTDIMMVDALGPGGNGMWAYGPSDIDNSAGGSWDVDGLDMWGPEPQTGFDADMYSLQGLGGGAFVYHYDQTSGISRPILDPFEIAGALGITDQFIIDQLDIDAMMVNATMDNDIAVQKEIIFSLAPISGLYDGGEIWVWNGLDQFGNPTMAQYLNHGGYTWDTSLDVMGTFGVQSENVNALEAISYSVVPEPLSSTLFIIGGASLGFRRFIRRKLA